MMLRQAAISATSGAKTPSSLSARAARQSRLAAGDAGQRRISMAAANSSTTVLRLQPHTKRATQFTRYITFYYFFEEGALSYTGTYAMRALYSTTIGKSIFGASSDILT